MLIQMKCRLKDERWWDGCDKYCYFIIDGQKARGQVASRINIIFLLRLDPGGGREGQPVHRRRGQTLARAEIGLRGQGNQSAPQLDQQGQLPQDEQSGQHGDADQRHRAEGEQREGEGALQGDGILK